jgi:hypothetical protein
MMTKGKSRNREKPYADIKILQLSAVTPDFLQPCDTFLDKKLRNTKPCLSENDIERHWGMPRDPGPTVPACELDHAFG